MIISIIEIKITVFLYSEDESMAASVKPVLLNSKQIQALKTIQEECRKNSGIGVAPSIHEIARGLMDKALAAGSGIIPQNC